MAVRGKRGYGCEGRIGCCRDILRGWLAKRRTKKRKSSTRKRGAVEFLRKERGKQFKKKKRNQIFK